ncbi:MAG: rod shape-determining protein MreC [Acidiferrobacteraceae bacterium]
MPFFAARPRKTISRWLQLVFYVLLSITFLLARGHDWVRTTRSGLDFVLLPLRYAAAFPSAAVQDSARYLRTDSDLRRSNLALRKENMRLRAGIERYHALEAQNQRLRSLLSAARRVTTRAIAASILSTGSAPFARMITLDRGATSGVYVREPVIDDKGIVGQVFHVSRYSCQVILVTDPDQEIPVEDVRSGERTIVAGTGAPDRLDVPYLTPSADIRPGDLLVSSGLGGVFPSGYPVARVLSVHNNPNEAFLRIAAAPAARLNEGHHVLLIDPKNPGGGRR